MSIKRAMHCSPRLTFTLFDVGIAIAIFCGLLAYNVDFTPRRRNPLHRPYVSHVACASYASMAYLAIRMVTRPVYLGVALTVLYWATVSVASLWYLVLTGGNLWSPPTLEPISKIWFPIFGWLLMFGVNYPPGPEQEQLQLLGYTSRGHE